MNQEEIPDIKKLRGLCQSTAPNPARESFVGKFSRKFSIYFTWILLHTRITPNQITVLSVLIFFVGTALFLKNDFNYNIIGSFVIFLSIILDGCDGEVARFRKRASLAGTNYVEPVSHDIQYGFMFPLIGFGLCYFQGFPLYYAVLGTIAGLAKLQYRFLEIRYWQLQNAKEQFTNEKIEKMKDNYKNKHTFVRFFYWVNKNFFSSTGVFFLIFLFSIFDRIDIYLWIFAVAYTGLWSLLFTKQVYLISKQKI